MNNPELNLTSELARLLYYTANIATAIRQCSEKKNANTHRLVCRKDIWQLADALHNFDLLGHAILANNPKVVLRVCGLLLKDYQRYSERHALPLENAMAAVNLTSESSMVDFHEGVRIITEIQARVRGQICMSFSH